MQIVLNIPDAAATRVVNAIAATYNYDLNKLAGETKPQFAKRMTGKWWKSIVVDHEAQVASRNAAQQVAAEVDQNVSIT